MQWIIPVLLVLLILLRWVPSIIERFRPFPYLISLIGLAWVPALAYAIVCALLGWVAPAWVSCAIALWVLSLRVGYVRNVFRKTTEQKPQLTCMTLNCRFGRADANHIVSTIRDQHVDILALQEVTTDLIDRLKAAGINELLPYCQLGQSREGDNGGFNALFSNIKPTASFDSIILDYPGAQLPSMHFSIPGLGTVAAFSVHPKSPMRSCKDRLHGLSILSALPGVYISTKDESRAEEYFPLTLVMGDLNATLDTKFVRRWQREEGELKDAAFALGKSSYASFPSWTAVPLIELDHILYRIVADAPEAGDSIRNFRVRRVKNIAITNTDHLAIVSSFVWN